MALVPSAEPYPHSRRGRHGLRSASTRRAFAAHDDLGVHDSGTQTPGAGRPPSSRKAVWRDGLSGGQLIQMRELCGMAGLVVRGKLLNKLVDLEGFEPSTSSMPWKRAPNCATGPFESSTFARIPRPCCATPNVGLWRGLGTRVVLPLQVAASRQARIHACGVTSEPPTRFSRHVARRSA